MPTMDTDKQEQIQTHVRAIAVLLADETTSKQLTTLEGIEPLNVTTQTLDLEL